MKSEVNLSMFVAYKYRLYPNKDQKNLITKTFGVCRFVYNYYLNKKIELYKKEKKNLTKYQCDTHCNRSLKNEFEWIREVDKFAVTNAIFNLDIAYQNFFNNDMNFPKFKTKHSNYNSYTTSCANHSNQVANIEVNFSNNLIKLPKLKWIECKLHRKFVGKIKSVTVIQVPSGKYFVSILVDTEIQQLPENKNIIAFDLGLKEFLIDTNGNHIDRPKALYQYEGKIKKLQRQLCKMTKHSNNYKKQVRKIAKLYERITNIRNDFSNKLSMQIINENQVIISEDLKISDMLKNHNLAKSVSDACWCSFMYKLSYKSKWYGRTYHKIDTWFASSQTCSECGAINKKVKILSVRNWVCKECGAIHQRDENAAKNILKQGLKELGLAM
jgi:putative transposase